MSSEANGAGDADSVGDADATDDACSSSAAYTHDPAAFDEHGEPRSPGSSSEHGPREAGERVDGNANAPDGRSGDPAHPADIDREFDWRGWTLVGVIVLSFLVVPAIVLWRPPSLPFRVALLILPLVPAFLLGATAVWAAVRGGEAE